MDELDAADFVVAHRQRVARVLRASARFVDDGRFRVTTRALRLLRQTLEEMLHPAADEAPPSAKADPPPAAADKPPPPPPPAPAG